MISEPDSTLTSTIAILKLVFPCIAIYTRVEIKTRLTMNPVIAESLMYSATFWLDFSLPA
ncbi:hypothetical protein [Methanobrevibacter woesei]|uniref:hypothetical protein n=1 Tax=Methanobrevibacter woesei TaxID=190976 RepID=UPI0026E0D587|nr:hypothetical protein [Methanobrevibacter woesei]